MKVMTIVGTRPELIRLSLIIPKLDKYCDQVLVIDVPESLQVERTVTRDNTSEEQVAAILNAQMTREERRRKADDIIVNDTTLDALHTQVQELHKRYLEAAIAHPS